MAARGAASVSPAIPNSAADDRLGGDHRNRREADDAPLHEWGHHVRFHCMGGGKDKDDVDRDQGTLGVSQPQDTAGTAETIAPI